MKSRKVSFAGPVLSYTSVHSDALTFDTSQQQRPSIKGTRSKVLEFNKTP